jgi:hypothetical protein
MPSLVVLLEDARNAAAMLVRFVHDDRHANNFSAADKMAIVRTADNIERMHAAVGRSRQVPITAFLVSNKKEL